MKIGKEEGEGAVLKLVQLLGDEVARTRIECVLDVSGDDDRVGAGELASCLQEVDSAFCTTFLADTELYLRKERREAGADEVEEVEGGKFDESFDDGDGTNRFV